MTVKIRSAAAVVGATLHGLGDGRARIDFDAAQTGVAAGQACVFYDGSRVLGGGWIKSAQGAFGTKDAFPVEAPLPAEAFLVQSR